MALDKIRLELDQLNQRLAETESTVASLSAKVSEFKGIGITNPKDFSELARTISQLREMEAILAKDIELRNQLQSQAGIRSSWYPAQNWTKWQPQLLGPGQQTQVAGLLGAGQQTTGANIRDIEVPEGLGTASTFIEKLNRALGGSQVLLEAAGADMLKYGETVRNSGIEIQAITNEQALFDNETVRVTADVATSEGAILRLSKTYDLLGGSIDKTAAAANKLSPEQQEKAFKTQRYAQYFKLGARLGYEKEDLKRIVDLSGTGVQRLSSQTVDAEGHIRNLTGSIDEMGNVLLDTPRRMLPFGQAVARDIIELTKWTIAIGVIYAPLRKLQEITTLMVDNQAKLADATIAVSNANVGMAEIFSAAAAAAEETATPINGVIEGFTLAYRATGNLGDVQARMATASRLMVDSLILSKLAAMDQASAIDTLAASLRQEGMSLDAGRELLDKWVKTTKVANVDLNTLSTSFAVLGDSADAAGLSIDELNGLIATIAETGISAGRETANMGRAIVSGFQSQRAAAELQKFGIAVNDVTTGQLRPFMSVMKEIYDMRQSGVLSAADLSALTLALGGGTRRQAVYTTFLENFGRVQQVAAQSAIAHGDAEEALGRKLDTVQTAVTRLGNAFQSLAQSLGYEGGLLDIFKAAIDLATVLVNALDKVTAALGKMGPLLYTISIGALLMKATRTPMAALASSIGGMVAGTRLSTLEGGGVNPSGVWNPQNVNPEAQKITTRERMGFNIAGFMTSKDIIPNLIKGGLLTAIPVAMNLANTQDKYRWTKAGADVAGAIVGGIISAGNPIGMVVGSAIAEAFVNATIARKTDLMAYMPYGTPETTATTAEEVSTKALEAAETTIKGDWIRQIGAALWQAALNLEINKTNKQRIAEGQEPLPKIKLEEVYYYFSTQQQKAAMDAARKGAQIAAGEYTPVSFTTGQKALQEKNATLLATIKAQQEAVFRTELATGELTGGKFTIAMKNLGTFAVRATSWYQAFGKQLEDASDRVDNASDAFGAFMDIIAYGSEEEIQTLTDYKSLIQELQGWMEQATEAIKAGVTSMTVMLPGETEAIPRTPQQVISTAVPLLQDAQRTIAEATARMLTDIQYNKIAFPTIANTTVVSMEEALKGLTGAYEEQIAYLKANPLITPEDIKEYESRIEDFVIAIDQGGKKVYLSMSKLAEQLGIPLVAMEFYSTAMQDAAKAATGLDFQTFDMTLQEFQNAMSGYPALLSQLTSVGYISPEDNEFIGVFKDSISKQDFDQKIVQLLLQRLVDINQEQLDGMYNLPEGATFWVPITAAYYRRAAGGGAGGGLDTRALDTSANKLDTAGEGLINAANKLDLAIQNMIANEERGGMAQTDWVKILEPWKQPVYQWGTTPYTGKKETPEDYALRHPGATTVFGTESADSILQDIQTFFTEFFRRLTTPQDWGKPWNPFQQGTNVNPNTPIGLNTNINPTPVSKVDININNKTQLLVDGRTLATVIKPYLMNDILRAQRGIGTSTRVNVVS